MKLTGSTPTGSSVALALATGALLAQSASGLPSPEPKASWVRKGHGRKAISDVLKGKRDARLNAVLPRNETTLSSCAGTAAVEITAPKQNIWDQLEDVDAAGVVAWLFEQPEFNLTVSENATAWDNSVYVHNLLRCMYTKVLTMLSESLLRPFNQTRLMLWLTLMAIRHCRPNGQRLSWICALLMSHTTKTLWLGLFHSTTPPRPGRH